MSHRIARLLQPLLRFLHRPHGPTVHHTGHQPPRVAGPPALPGIGLGSLGMPAVGAEATK
ncbi:hypothetical protein [Streptomyces camelliae]|uniref:Uncharacterized protein n=1 Tax=Streptomyces camelliae TaxID=3004093 RepID=A0ABY7P6J4_9ACTN|nr:hypothetical protein [Streptomyces sp. HUAS 2-6]WBO66186.1 hypothetical protein O1G22_26960 [Streptomyces sp. HUAS 2-6]